MLALPGRETESLRGTWGRAAPLGLAAGVASDNRKQRDEDFAWGRVVGVMMAVYWMGNGGVHGIKMQPS